jgi:hypothetical protein
MKTRAIVPFVLSSLLMPTLAAEWGAPSLMSAPVAHAQPSDAITEVARQRYNDGVAFYDAGRFEEARAAFLQAYALKRHPAVLLNLGQSELRSNHPVDAGNHLQQFLREHKEATPDQRAAAQKGIEEAKKKAPHVIVIVDADGADISVDGAIVGKSPLIDPVFVEPGKHTFVASYGGKSATTSLDARVGPAMAANLSLGVGGAAASPMGPAVGPAPDPGAPPPPQPTGPGFTFGGPPGPQPDAPERYREPFFDWYTSKPLAWVGTGVAGAGLAMGIIFSITASSASSAAEQHAAEIEAEAAKDGIDRPCGSEDNDANDVPKYQSACNTLRDDLSDHDTSVAVATVGWVLFGVGVVGTVTYAMIDWFPGEPVQSASGPRVIAVTPVVSPTHQGVGVIGTF